MSLFRRSPTQVWSLDGPDDSRLVLCSFPCLELYLEVLDPEGDAEVARVELHPGTAACVYCAGCGSRVAAAPLCIIHEDGCPEFSWRAAMAMQREFRDCWLEEVGSEVPDEGWEIAEVVASSDPTLSPAGLVAVVIGTFES